MKPLFVTGLVTLLSVMALASAQHQLVVTVTDQGISISGQVQSDYTRFVLENRASDVYAHEFVRLKDGADAEAVRQALPALLSGCADEATFGIVMANTDSFLGGAVGTPAGGEREVGLVLTPSSYLVYADHITDAGPGVDVAHTALVTVAEAASPTTAPEDDLTVELAEYAFALPADLTAGTHLVRFENVGTETHLGFVFELPEGMTVEEAMYEEGPVDWANAQGVHALDPGAVVYAAMTVEPSRTYLFDCPLPNDQGMPHDRLGMMQS